MADDMKLSIIIPTKNRANLLRGVLQSIVDQKADQSKYEVLVIDNGSTDETQNVPKQFQEKIQNLRYIYDDRPGLHVGRNLGIVESQGELIGYLDDDVVLFPDWINTVIRAFDDAKVMRVCGSVIPFDMSFMTEEFMSRHAMEVGSYWFVGAVSCFWQEGISEADTRVQVMRENLLVGANTVFRKDMLYACKGFHPDGMPRHLLMYRGDGESYVARFMWKRGMKSMYYAQASVYHMIDINRVNASYIRYMYFRNGISDMYTVLRDGGGRGGLRFLRQMLLDNCLKQLSNENIQFEFLGQLYLGIYYLFYPRVRKWVHKKSYF